MGLPLGGTEVHDMWSEVVGDSFRVFVGHCGPNPQAILFVTDANGLFGLAVDTVRLMQIPGLVPSLVVIGVGYPDADAVIDTVEIRARDLTPTPTGTSPDPVTPTPSSSSCPTSFAHGWLVGFRTLSAT